MEQPRLPDGTAPRDIYYYLANMPDSCEGNPCLAADNLEEYYPEMGCDWCLSWVHFWLAEKERVRLLAVQADKEWALTELLLRGKHGAAKTA